MAEVASNASPLLALDPDLYTANCDEDGKFVEECAPLLAEWVLAGKDCLYVRGFSPEASTLLADYGYSGTASGGIGFKGPVFYFRIRF
jgi:hypothetical protein